ncbi:hypothetical protein CHR55_27450 [Rhodococcus qingshengii]|uniref:Pentapeptide repeat-containing protein n=1 Tax=Rhodococcus qingshengii TaxID=334542 RepID=A0A2A5J3M2_RHOSG|nr:hypothetical protein CHR55_27450 [Rhodococcus qingshengii]
MVQLSKNSKVARHPLHVRDRQDSAVVETAGTSGANASDVNLYNASMYGTNLTGVDFSGAYMRHANLAHSGLSGAILIGADLFEADLTGGEPRKCLLGRFDPVADRFRRDPCSTLMLNQREAISDSAPQPSNTKSVSNVAISPQVPARSCSHTCTRLRRHRWQLDAQVVGPPGSRSWGPDGLEHVPHIEVVMVLPSTAVVAELRPQLLVSFRIDQLRNHLRRGHCNGHQTIRSRVLPFCPHTAVSIDHRFLRVQPIHQLCPDFGLHRFRLSVPIGLRLEVTDVQVVFDPEDRVQCSGHADAVIPYRHLVGDGLYVPSHPPVDQRRRVVTLAVLVEVRPRLVNLEPVNVPELPFPQ